MSYFVQNHFLIRHANMHFGLDIDKHNFLLDIELYTVQYNEVQFLDIGIVQRSTFFTY